MKPRRCQSKTQNPQENANSPFWVHMETLISLIRDTHGKEKPKMKNTMGWSQLGFPEFITLESSTQICLLPQIVASGNHFWEKISRVMATSSLGTSCTNPPSWMKNYHLGKQVKEIMCLKTRLFYISILFLDNMLYDGMRPKEKRLRDVGEKGSKQVR